MTPRDVGPSRRERRIPSLLLVGAGHAHLIVLEALARGHFPAVRATWVAPRRHAYSAMVPGLIGGRYAPEELTFDCARLAQAAGAEFLEGRAARIDAARREVELEDGRRTGYDLLSLAVGSVPEGAELPGVREYARFLKPIDCGLDVSAALRGVSRVVVVGGGAAGVEVAFGVRARLPAAEVTVLERGERVLADRSAGTARLARRELARQDIALRTGAEVAEVRPAELALRGGERLPFDLLLWAAGAAPPPLFRASGLVTDDTGYLLVDDTLRSAADPRIFASGDSATLRSRPALPKAGVYAVREGPILRDNLARLAEAYGASAGAAEPALRHFHPQHRFLALLNTGDGRAIASWGPLAAHGRWAMRLKDAIDRRFMRRFQRLMARTAAYTY